MRRKPASASPAGKFVKSVRNVVPVPIFSIRLFFHILILTGRREAVPPEERAAPDGYAFLIGGCEGPENCPVDSFHRTTGRQALVVDRAAGRMRLSPPYQPSFFNENSPDPAGPAHGKN